MHEQHHSSVNRLEWLLLLLLLQSKVKVLRCDRAANGVGQVGLTKGQMSFVPVAKVTTCLQRLKIFGTVPQYMALVCKVG